MGLPYSAWDGQMNLTFSDYFLSSSSVPGTVLNSEKPEVNIRQSPCPPRADILVGKTEREDIN